MQRNHVTNRLVVGEEGRFAHSHDETLHAQAHGWGVAKDSLGSCIVRVGQFQGVLRRRERSDHASISNAEDTASFGGDCGTNVDGATQRHRLDLASTMASHAHSWSQGQVVRRHESPQRCTAVFGTNYGELSSHATMSRSRPNGVHNDASYSGRVDSGHQRFPLDSALGWIYQLHGQSTPSITIAQYQQDRATGKQSLGDGHGR
mmetsp:Transcript_11832/g.20051  ORF Transcript_11832/g.20051 Transcript_11832/m.20051 type:complete len:204 (-) Transcript_11832:297-908(-)